MIPGGIRLKARMLHLLVAVALFSSAGATCPRQKTLVNDYAPTVLTPEATLEDVIRVVNANSSRIQQVQSDTATLTFPGAPPLNTTYSLDRPRRFRMRSELSRVLGPELDLGSNDEIYWIYVRQSERPAVYWGRHEEFRDNAGREILPIPPDWLIQALGVVELDPTGRHEGPLRNRPGQLEIRSQIVLNDIAFTKVTVIDDARGWVLEQHLYNDAQQPVASVVASAFHFDQLQGVSLPRFVEVRLPPAGLAFSLQTDRHLINQSSSESGAMWTLPQLSGVPTIPLSEIGAANATPGAALQSRRPQRVVARPVAPRDAAIRRLPPFDRLR